MITPADEFPIHQSPRPVAEPATSDRNFYDRNYFNAHDGSGDLFLVTGLGTYPNLGVVDAYATIRHGDRQTTVRVSDAAGDDRLDQSVGPYRTEIVEPLSRIRLVCDADRVGDHPIGFDIEWTGSFPVVQEARHVMRKGERTILDAQRFAQVGSWAGELRFDGRSIELDPAVWTGSRDRSWGIRPVGDSDPADRGDAEMAPDWGMWWVYSPLRFDDFATVIVLQEDGVGYRSLNDAVTVDSAGAITQLGWPQVDVTYVPGTRQVESAVITGSTRRGPYRIEVESKSFVALNAGPGYGGDPEWSHGLWKGRDWIDSSTVDLTDPEVAGRVPFGTVDHVAVARFIDDDGVRNGVGLFEHMSIGAHAPTGFTDFFSVA